jgi:5-methylcytosine-specific restriction endonuclease McrA
MEKGKRCPKCKRLRPIADFVDTGGSSNKLGRYCIDCHRERLAAAYSERIEEEKSFISKLKIVYGEDWRQYAFPHQFEITLFSERDFCPYCGGNLEQSASHMDHMDPLELGGEDSIRNAVYCCQKCNLKKGVRSFVEWLNQLIPEFKELSRALYIEKHGNSPESFTPGTPTVRTTTGCIDAVLLLDEEELKEMYMPTDKGNLRKKE